MMSHWVRTTLAFASLTAGIATFGCTPEAEDSATPPLEMRRSAIALGEGCVVDADCHTPVPGGNDAWFCVDSVCCADQCAGGSNDCQACNVVGSEGTCSAIVDDADGDGVCDPADPCPNDNPDDTDGDGVCDTDDTCPNDNPDDTDGDGVCDTDDICALGDDNLDADGDGVPDACDQCAGGDDNLNSDTDGVPDFCDCAPGDPQVWVSCGTCQDVDGDTHYVGCDAYTLPMDQCDDAMALPNVDVAAAWTVSGCSTCQDADGDSEYGACDAPKPLEDCDDTPTGGSINHAATEVCATVGVDDNCNGIADEGYAVNGTPQGAYPVPADATTYFLDQDGDSYGDPANSRTQCTQPANYVVDDTDCAPLVNPANPGQVADPCDGVDSNCRGGLDEVAITAAPCTLDSECNGTYPTAICHAGGCVLPCATDAECAPLGATVQCHDIGGIDACSGELWYWPDLDADTYGDDAVPPTAACSILQPPQTVDRAGDCNDNPAGGGIQNPGLPELCATVGIDDNCNSIVDEATAGDSLLFYLDADGDGEGDPDPTKTTYACLSAPPGFSPNSNDCDDGDAARATTLIESCDGVDNDCDTVVDEVSAAPVPAALTRPDFVVYFHFDDVSLPAVEEDVAGFRTEGQILAPAARTQGAPVLPSEVGRYGQGLVLAPAGRMTLTDNARELDLSGSYTLMAWVKIGADGYLMSHGSPQNWGWYVGNATMSFTGSSGSTATVATGALTLDTWHHLAVTFDGSALRFYLDGAQTGGPQGGDYSLNQNHRPLVVGDSAGTLSMTGIADEVMAWHGALSAAEIAEVKANLGWAGAAVTCVEGHQQPCQWGNDACPAPGEYCEVTRPIVLTSPVVVPLSGSGAGYIDGETLEVRGGVGTPAQITVHTNSSGVVTSASMASGGSYTVEPPLPATFSGGKGVGLQVTFTLGGGGGVCAQTGPCTEGRSVCTPAHTFECDSLVGVDTADEECDGIDNDCDHLVDEPPDGGDTTTYAGWFDAPCTGVGTFEACGADDSLTPCANDPECTTSGEICYRPVAGQLGACARVSLNNGIYYHQDCPAPEQDVGALQFCIGGKCQLTGDCRQGVRRCVDGTSWVCAQDELAAVGPSPEECDAFDNDCDGALNEANSIPPLESPCCIGPDCDRSCTSDTDCPGGQTCDVTGLHICVCATDDDCLQPPGFDPEECNFGIYGTQGVCSLSGVCGNGGVVCTAAFSLACEPLIPPLGPGVAEADVVDGSGFPLLCDNFDNDCNGIVDDGLTRGCDTACSVVPLGGTQTCSFGTWGSCSERLPIPEDCNGIDDDCDGSIDEDVIVSCSNICGAGYQVCTGGTLSACTAPQPEAEVCDGFDNDCDGLVDEGACGCKVSVAAGSVGQEVPAGTYAPGSEWYYFWSPATSWPGDLFEMLAVAYHDNTNVKLFELDGTGAKTLRQSVDLASAGLHIKWNANTVLSVSVAVAGAGYSVGDTLAIGTNYPVRLHVDSVNATQGITGVSLVDSGALASRPTNPAGASGGTGAGAAFNLSYGLFASDSYWKIETDKPVGATVGDPTNYWAGSMFFSAVDGKRWGREFYVHEWRDDPAANQHTRIYARKATTVTIYPDVRAGQLNPAPLPSLAIPAGGWVQVDLTAGQVHRVEADHQVAIERQEGNGFTQVPPSDTLATDCRNDVGHRFVFSTSDWAGGRIGVFNPNASSASFELHVLNSDGSVGALVANETLAANETYTNSANLGDDSYLLTVISGPPLMVWAGDDEGGNTIDDMGDDFTMTYGDSGRAFLLRAQTHGIRIVAADDDTTVTTDGSSLTLDANQWYVVPTTLTTLRIVSDKPVTVIASGGNAFNDYGMALWPAARYDTDGDGRPDVGEGGSCDSIAPDDDGDGIPNYRDPNDRDFPIEAEWSWAGGPVAATPAVADLDGDGNSDIIVAEATNLALHQGRLVSMQSAGGAMTVTSPSTVLVSPYATPAVGEVDGGHAGLEIVTLLDTGGVGFFHQDLGWYHSTTTVTTAAAPNYGSLAIADIDGNGTAEVVGCHFALDGSGTVLFDHSTGGTLSDACSPAVANLDGGPASEIVVGAVAYRANGSIFWDNTTLRGEWGDRGGAAPALARFGDVTVNTDVEVVLNRDGNVYVLSGSDGSELGRIPHPGGVGFGGAPTIADFDGDGLVEIGAASGTKYTVFSVLLNNGNAILYPQWSVDVTDSEGRMAATAFDLNGDAVTEILMRDDTGLMAYHHGDASSARLVDLALGGPVFAAMPVVADLQTHNVSHNHDGAQLIVGHSGGLEVYQSSSTNGWAATRPTWNQASYHGTNVDDAGAIPSNETESWTTSNTYRANVSTAALSAAPDLRPIITDFVQGGSAASLGGRVSNGLIAFYNFQEGSGTTVYDRSGFGTPMDMSITTPAAVKWVSGGGLEIKKNMDNVQIVADATDSTKLRDEIMATGEFTVEVFLNQKKDSYSDSKPKRIVSYSLDNGNRNFTLGATDPKTFNMRRRLKGVTDDNGVSALQAANHAIKKKKLQHVAYVRRADGFEAIYVDGVLSNSQTVVSVPADEPFDGWNAGYQFGIANEVTGNRGLVEAKYYLVAIYNRALGEDEILQNMGEGTSATLTSCAAFNQLTVDLCNEGEVEAPSGTRVAVYYGDPSLGDLASELALETPLAVDECRPLVFEWITDRVGATTLNVVADYLNEVPECFETNNMVGKAATMTAPTIDLCDGLDNDCDGLNDNGPVQACGGTCTGNIVCTDGVPGGCGNSQPEICDGIDNDCDLVVDDVYDACGDGFLGCMCDTATPPNCQCVAVQEAGTESGCGEGCPVGQLCVAAEGGGLGCVPFCQTDLNCPTGTHCVADNVCQPLDEYVVVGEDEVRYGADLKGESACSTGSLLSGSEDSGLVAWLALLGALVVVGATRRR